MRTSTTYSCSVQAQEVAFMEQVRQGKSHALCMRVFISVHTTYIKMSFFN